MNIDLTPLNLGNSQIVIEEKVNFPKEYFENTDLIDLQNVMIKGNIEVDSLNDYILNLKITGKMILPCSRTLKPTDYEFETEIEENIHENGEKFQKSIDILPIIWENILMEIPIKIISPEAEEMEMKGDGWELITDSEGH